MVNSTHTKCKHQPKVQMQSSVSISKSQIALR